MKIDKGLATLVSVGVVRDVSLICVVGDLGRVGYLREQGWPDRSGLRNQTAFLFFEVCDNARHDERRQAGISRYFVTLKVTREKDRKKKTIYSETRLHTTPQGLKYPG